MGSLTKGQRDAERKIEDMIVLNHRFGKCDKEGRPYPKFKVGCGHLHCGTVPFGEQHIKVWPRDEHGNLIGD